MDVVPVYVTDTDADYNGKYKAKVKKVTVFTTPRGCPVFWAFHDGRPHDVSVVKNVHFPHRANELFLADLGYVSNACETNRTPR